MTTAGFMMSFNQIERLLKDFNIWRMNGVKSIIKEGVSEDFRSASIKDDYFNAYNIGLDNYDFDFLLKDQSYFQFEYNNKGKNLEIRYAFFQTPIDYISYEDFLCHIKEEQGITETVEEIGSLFIEDYNQFLSEQEAKNKYTTLRYDVDYSNYKPIIHSVSHLHIGHQNHLRIPIEKFISPLKFVMFSIKHVYYKEWKEMCEKNPHYVNKLLKSCSSGETLLSSKYWTDLEKLEMFIK